MYLAISAASGGNMIAPFVTCLLHVLGTKADAEDFVREVRN